MKTVTIDIRRAEPGDANAIAEVHGDAWANAYSGLIPHKALSSMIGRRGGLWWSNAIRKAASVLVLEMDSEIAGYATLGRNRAQALPQGGEIYELYLRPDYQGIGLGGRLFSAARRKLADHGFEGLVVWALEENHNAISFYQNMGGRDAAEGVEIFDHKALRKVAFVWN